MKWTPTPARYNILITPLISLHKPDSPDSGEIFLRKVHVVHPNQITSKTSYIQKIALKWNTEYLSQSSFNIVKRYSNIKHSIAIRPCLMELTEAMKKIANIIKLPMLFCVTEFQSLASRTRASGTCLPVLVAFYLGTCKWCTQMIQWLFGLGVQMFVSCMASVSVYIIPNESFAIIIYGWQNHGRQNCQVHQNPTHV